MSDVHVEPILARLRFTEHTAFGLALTALNVGGSLFGTNAYHINYIQGAWAAVCFAYAIATAWLLRAPDGKS